jgi:hypothetical protein
VLNLPEVREPLTSVMADVTPSASPKACAEFLAVETVEWAKVVKASGAKEG